MDRVLFFDGYCSLCNGFVDWVMRRDKQGRIHFASLQGETARNRLPAELLSTSDPDTLIYLREGKIHNRSTGVLLMLKDLGGIWSAFQIFLLVPPFLRDLVYRFVAKIRYRVFGRRDTCRLPTPDEKGRLLP